MGFKGNALRTECLNKHYWRYPWYDYYKVMCLKPPLCANKSDVDFTINVLDTIFGNHYLKAPRSWRQYDSK